MLEACRTCLGLIDVDESPYYEIEDDEVKLSTESCRYKLLSIVPKMALDITPKSILCAECHESLESLFEFKEKCLKTENIITRYLQTKPGIKKFHLKDVSDFNTNNFRIIKDDDVDTSFEDEVELSGSIITNVMHEIDDFSRTVARPKSAVPAFSDDIDAVEDKTFKEEVELSETVVTNVKVEVDSSESVAVAKNTVNVVPADKDDIDVNKDKTMEVSVEDDALKEKVELSETVVTNIVAKKKKKKKKVRKSNFLCEHCDKRFKRASSLKPHLRTHTGEKPYRCEICDRRFRQTSHLKEHLRIHTERPYQCDTCRKEFRERDSLIRHLKRGYCCLKNVECKYCKKRFFRKVHVKTHIMNVHKDVTSKL